MKKTQKKLLRNILVLSSGLIVILLFYIFKAKPQSEKKLQKDHVLLIPDKKKDDFIRIYIQFRDEKKITHLSILEKISNQWEMIAPVRKAADQGRVYQMIDDLLNIESERILQNITSDRLTNYGIYDPSDKFIFTFSDGTSNIVINGKLAKTENYYYTWQNSSSNRILVTYAYRFSSSELKPAELIEKQIFTLPIDDLSFLSMTGLNGVSLDFRLRKDTWTLNSSKNITLDPYAVKKKLLDIYSLRISSFDSFSRNTADLTRLGLLDSPYTIKLGTPNSQIQLYISRKTNFQGNYAYSPQIPGIFFIDPKDLEHHFNLDFHSFEKQQEE